MDIFKKKSDLIERIKQRIFIEKKEQLLKSNKKDIKKASKLSLLIIPSIFLSNSNLDPKSDLLISLLYGSSILLLAGGIAAMLINICFIYDYIKTNNLKKYEDFKNNKCDIISLNKKEIEEVLSSNLIENNLNAQNDIFNYGTIFLHTLEEANKQKENIEDFKNDIKIKELISKLDEKIIEEQKKEKNMSQFFDNIENISLYNKLNAQIKSNINLLFKEKELLENVKEVEINKIDFKKLI